MKIKIKDKEIDIPKGLFRCSVCQRPATDSIAEVEINLKAEGISNQEAEEVARQRLNQDPMKYQVYFCGYHKPLRYSDIRGKQFLENIEKI